MSLVDIAKICPFPIIVLDTECNILFMSTKYKQVIADSLLATPERTVIEENVGKRLPLGSIICQIVEYIPGSIKLRDADTLEYVSDEFINMCYDVVAKIFDECQNFVEIKVNLEIYIVDVYAQTHILSNTKITIPISKELQNKTDIEVELLTQSREYVNSNLDQGNLLSIRITNEELGIDVCDMSTATLEVSEF